VFHLRRPFSSYYVNFFSSAGANPCILPKHKFDSTKINTAAYNDLPVGSGPFKYASRRRNDAVEMVGPQHRAQHTIQICGIFTPTRSRRSTTCARRRHLSAALSHLVRS